MVNGAALYVGTLRHRRFQPTPHAFTYPLFMVLVDVDRVAEQMAASRLTSVNRFNWASFDDRDHLGEPSEPLRTRVAADADRHGLSLPAGPIYLLTHLRYLGYNFNPISFYFCCNHAGEVELVMAEVHSTFGEQCTYWLSVLDGPSFRARLPKIMHVSPFMGMDVDYEFVVTPPGDRFVAHMNTIERGGERPYFDATLTLARRPWTALEIRKRLFRHPLMTARVIGAIHWEALRLWAKGLRVYAHPRDPQARRAGREVS
jgi:DUF1365 family protein